MQTCRRGAVEVREWEEMRDRGAVVNGSGRANLLLTAFGRLVDAQVDCNVTERRFQEYRHVALQSARFLFASS